MTTWHPLALSVLALSLASCGQKPVSHVKEAWNEANDPLNLGTGYERRLSQLPKSAQLAVTPWSDTYWPSQQGGIAYRWHAAKPAGFDYTLATQAQVASMSVADLSQLSPAEKYDIYVGKYNYPLLHAEWSRTSPSNASWEGICHGWSPAALNFAEPKAVLATGARGVKVPFGAGDIKALLDLYQGNYANSDSRLLGARCDVDLKLHPESANLPECRGINPGTFHLVLANFLGVRKQGFVANVTRYLEVWNQPVSGFSTKYLKVHAPSAGAAAGTYREVDVETKMTYTTEIEPNWTPVVGTDGQSNTTVTYKYRLELDADGEIIGGEWQQEARPDLLWTQDKPTFTGSFKALGDLYSLSQNASTPALADPTANAVSPTLVDDDN